MSYYDDVGDFHRKFDLPAFGTARPDFPSTDALKFRGRFLLEELAELFEAMAMPGPAGALRAAAASLKVVDDGVLLVGAPDLHKAADAIADIVYVALGTAHLMGLPFEAVWDAVQRANMAKERASSAADPRSTRAHSLDVVKPAGWSPPNHWDAINLARAMYDGSQRRAG